LTAEPRRTLRSHSAAEPQLTEEGKPIRRATGYEHQKLKPRYPASGSRVRELNFGPPLELPVTHRFLRRGEI
jgi:hypothetical protein